MNPILAIPGRPEALAAPAEPAVAAPAVLHLIETGGPGGAERMLVHLASGIAPDFRSHAALLREGWLAASLRRHGVPVTLLRYGRDRAPARLRSLATLQDVLRLVRGERVALLHTHEFFMNLLGLLVSRATGIPQVATVHGKNYYGDRWRRRAIYRLVGRFTGALVAVSEDIGAFLADRVGVAPGHIRVVPNGVPLPPAASRERILRGRRDLGVEDDAPVVIAVGSLYPVKGHVHLVEAARAILDRVPRAQILLVGGGGLRESLEARARANGVADRVRLLGHRDDVADLLALSDVFVLPSLSEGTPLALLEAMAAGLPAVASRVGGVGAVIEPGITGILVPPADSHALAEGITGLLEDRDRARAMGRAAREAVGRRFSSAAMLGAYQALYRRLLEPRPLRGAR